MATPKSFTFPFPVTCHAFNKDRSQVAVCPNTNIVHIYKKDGNQWTQTHTLTEHDLLVTDIDWAPESDRIVTCSQDKNAYVWNFDGQNWKPTLVHLRLNRAATCVKWSPFEDKFAVGSGSRCISVCYFGEDNDWWVSKHIKKPIMSTVLSLDWHPNNVLLAAGSADMKARVFSAYIKGVDQKPSPSVWGEKLPFNTLCGEFTNPCGGWIHSVAFSPSGDGIAWLGHDASLSIAYPGHDYLVNIRTNNLPYLTMVWAAEDKIIAAGHDCCPVLFQGDADGWKFVKSLDEGHERKDLSVSSAFNKFRQMDIRGSSSGSSQPTELKTTHQNSIIQMRVYSGDRDDVKQISTSAKDGRLVIWDLAL
ncbi:ARP2/3 actin-organizing complex subunit Sop2 [Basidiobolus ranarum]|uniref:Actin-related protein 2/3 complex subunit n=1 Tax=Basidiobolus ranarum TaxID=34480 RepID=A0ABR2W0K3_9FUNG